MKACPICQSQYDDSVDFCFKDGAPLEASDEDATNTVGTETLSALLQDDLEPPDAISLSNIPSIGDQSLPGASDEDLLPPEPTFSKLKAVSAPDEDDDETAQTQVVPPADDPTGLPEDPAGLPEDPAGLPEDPAGLPEDPAGLPEDPAGLPDDPTGIPSAAAIGAADPAAPTQDLDDEADETIDDAVAPVVAAKGATKAPKAKAKVEVAPAKPKSAKRPTTTPGLSGSAVISARREAEPNSGNKGLLIGMALIAVLVLGFIFMTVTGKDDGGDVDGGEPTADSRGDSLPPLTPAKGTPATDGSPDGAAEDATPAGGDAPDGEPANAEGDATPSEDAPDPEPTPEPEAAVAEPEATPEATPEPAPEPEATPEPTPAPVAEATPAPAPEPTPAGSAPEPPIAVVSADPTPAPAAAPADSPWGGTTPTPAPAPTPVDASNPWGATTAAASNGTLIVSSNPGGATVLVDGVSKGTTPLSIQLPFKDYEIRVSKDGHASQTRVVKVVGAKPINVDVALESLAAPQSMAVIIASNPGGAVVFVDGARKGPTPLTVGMSVGNHEIRLEAADLPACVRTLGVSANTRNAFYDLNNCQ